MTCNAAQYPLRTAHRSSRNVDSGRLTIRGSSTTPEASWVIRMPAGRLKEGLQQRDVSSAASVGNIVADHPANHGFLQEIGKIRPVDVLPLMDDRVAPALREVPEGSGTEVRVSQAMFAELGPETLVDDLAQAVGGKERLWGLQSVERTDLADEMASRAGLHRRGLACPPGVLPAQIGNEGRRQFRSGKDRTALGHTTSTAAVYPRVASRLTTGSAPTTSALWSAPRGTARQSPASRTASTSPIVIRNRPETTASILSMPWVCGGKRVPGGYMYRDTA